MPVERERRFEAECVPGTEPGGQQAVLLAAGGQGLPEPDGVVVGGVDLEAGGAGVAGAGDEDAQARDFTACDPETFGQWCLFRSEAGEDRAGCRALKREQGRCAAAVFDLHVCAGALADPVTGGLDVRGIHAEEEGVVSDAGEHHVVDAAAALFEQQAIARLPDRDCRDLAGHQLLGGGHRPLSAQLYLAHVRHVE